MKKPLLILLILSFLLSLAACSVSTAPAEEEAEPEPWVVPEEMRNDPYKYKHGPEGYYNLAEEGVAFNGGTQKGGTCWLYASVASMETAYSLRTGESITVDPIKILNSIYDKNREDGYTVDKSTTPMMLGGYPWMVVEEASNGCENYILDEAMIIYGQDIDEFKDIIKNRGGIAVGICDTAHSGKGNYGHYVTMYAPGVVDYDHEVTLIGWDDHFPKEFFVNEPSRDGAWIAYNSQNGKHCYNYFSYDTQFEGGGSVWLSVTDKYSEVLAYDAGHKVYRQIKAKDSPVTIANVFRKKGTLAAVGTYSDVKQQDIKIEIYDSSFKTLLYTQDASLDFIGYHTVELDTPLEVADYAIAVTYSVEAPVEGANRKDDRMYFKAVSEPGQSFLYLPETGEWKDMTDEDIRRTAGISFNPNNCCIKAIYY